MSVTKNPYHHIAASLLLIFKNLIILNMLFFGFILHQFSKFPKSVNLHLQPLLGSFWTSLVHKIFLCQSLFSSCTWMIWMSTHSYCPSGPPRLRSFFILFCFVFPIFFSELCSSVWIILLVYLQVNWFCQFHSAMELMQ